MYHAGKASTRIVNKCGVCINYEPLVKIDAGTKFKTKYCHGKCKLSGKYVQRTEKCKKFNGR